MATLSPSAEWTTIDDLHHHNEAQQKGDCRLRPGLRVAAAVDQHAQHVPGERLEAAAAQGGFAVAGAEWRRHSGRGAIASALPHATPGRLIGRVPPQAADLGGAAAGGER